jgi:hypothetical protein
MGGFLQAFLSIFSCFTLKSYNARKPSDHSDSALIPADQPPPDLQVASAAADHQESHTDRPMAASSAATATTAHDDDHHDAPDDDHDHDAPDDHDRHLAIHFQAEVITVEDLRQLIIQLEARLQHRDQHRNVSLWDSYISDIPAFLEALDKRRSSLKIADHQAISMQSHSKFASDSDQSYFCD